MDMEKEMTVRNSLKISGECSLNDVNYHNTLNQTLSILKDFHYSLLCENEEFNSLLDTLFYNNRYILKTILKELFISGNKETKEQRQDILCKYIYILSDNSYNDKLEDFSSEENFSLSIMLLICHIIVTGLFENKNELNDTVKKSLIDSLEMLLCTGFEIDHFFYEIINEIVGEM